MIMTTNANSQINREEHFSWRQIALGAILLLGLVLRIYHLDNKSLWVDEIMTARVSSGSLSDTLRRVPTNTAAAPLDYLILNRVEQISPSDFALRLPAVIWGTLSIFAIYLLAKKVTSSELTGLSAAFMLAISPTAIQYSQEARFYSLFTLMSILDVYLFILALQRPEIKRWLLLTGILILSFYTHYYTIFLIAGMGLFLVLLYLLQKLPFLRKDGLPQREIGDLASIPFSSVAGFSLSALVAVLAVFPWVFYARSAISSPFQYTPPSLYYLFVTPVLGTQVLNPVLGLYILPFFSLLGLLLARRERLYFFSLFALLIVVAIIGVVLADKITSYFVSSRQFLFAVPFYLILVASGIVSLSSLLSRRSMIAAIALSCIVLLGIAYLTRVHIRQYFYEPPQDNWRDTALFLRLQTERNPRSAILFSSPDLAPFILFYQPALADKILPLAGFFEQPASSDVDRLWLVSTNTDFIAKVSNHMGWSGASVDLRLSKSVPLFYLSPGDANALIIEAASLNLMPETMANSSFPFTLFALDKNRVLELSLEMVRLGNIDTPPLYINEKAILLGNVARMYLDTGQPQNAIKYAGMTLGLGSTSRDGMNNAGYIYLNKKQCSIAVSAFERSDEYNHDFDPTMKFLAASYRCAEDWRAAANVYHRLYEMRKNPAYLLEEANMYIQLDDSRHAGEILQTIIEEFPSSEQTLQAQELLNNIQQP